jgi:hypothetical protein
MPGVDRQFTFNAFHICMVVLVINLLINSNYDYIIDFVNYLISIETPGFWFIILHMLLVYLVLANVQFELGFRAAIKFNL